MDYIHIKYIDNKLLFIITNKISIFSSFYLNLVILIQIIYLFFNFVNLVFLIQLNKVCKKPQICMSLKSPKMSLNLLKSPLNLDLQREWTPCITYLFCLICMFYSLSSIFSFHLTQYNVFDVVQGRELPCKLR